MAEGVKDSMISIFMSTMGKTEDEAKQYLTFLKLENRYVEEIFGSHA